MSPLSFQRLYFFIGFKGASNLSLKHYFMIIALKSLSDNCNISVSQCCKLLSFLIQFEISLVLGIVDDLLLEDGYIGKYTMSH